MHGNFIEKLVRNGLTFAMKFPFFIAISLEIRPSENRFRLAN